MTLALTGLAAFAQAEGRPPSRGHAAPELFASTDGGLSPGALFLATLPVAAQETFKKDGQVVLDKGAGGSGPNLVKAVARFDRPKDEAYAIMTRVSEQASFLPNVQLSKTFGEHTAEGERTDYVVAFIFSFKYRTQQWFYPEQSRLEWKLDPTGGDGLQEQDGYWQLYELDSKTTIAEYGTHIVANGAILNFLRGVGERGAIADALRAFRKHVDTAKK